MFQNSVLIADRIVQYDTVEKMIVVFYNEHDLDKIEDYYSHDPHGLMKLEDGSMMCEEPEFNRLIEEIFGGKEFNFGKEVSIDHPEYKSIAFTVQN